MKLKSAFAVTVFVTALFAGMFAWNAARAEEAKSATSNLVRHAKAQEAASLLATNQITILDIRTPNEFASGHIAGATNINYLSADFSDCLAQLDRSKSYLLHCAAGGRSTNALPKLARLGFTNIIHLDGGLKAWQAAGNPVVKP